MMIERRASPRGRTESRMLDFFWVAAACSAGMLAWFALLKAL